MVGSHRVRGIGNEVLERLQLVGEHLEHQPRIEFGIVHVPRLEPPVVIVLHEVVVWVPRKRERVQPERVDRRLHDARQTRPVCREVREIMAQEVVSERVLDAIERRFELGQALVKVPIPATDRGGCTAPDRRKGEDLGRLRIDLQVDRETPIQKGTMAASGVDLVE